MTQFITQTAENDKLTEAVFNELEKGLCFERVAENTGVKKIEIDDDCTVVTIYYPDGEIVSHWV
jgi:hypothetical protein